jgi:hypothetical protein
MSCHAICIYWSNKMAQGIQAVAVGDVLVAASRLNNATDDHAGEGRILHFDAQLQLKNEIMLPHTTHLVGGLKFDSSGVLWAFDSQEFVILNLHRDGRVERRGEFGARPYSHGHFLSDGSVLLAEHVVGDSIKPEIAARMHTQLPYMPGTQRFGDGHVWHFSADGRLIKEYATATHGGMGGFLGVTMSAVSADERTLVYCSETGSRLMRYDLQSDTQLPDLQSFTPPFPPGPPPMFFAMQYANNGELWVLRGGSVHRVDAGSGETLGETALEGFGWALLELATGADTQAWVSNFFTGEVAKIDLQSGAKLASVQTGAPKAVAGLAEVR